MTPPSGNDTLSDWLRLQSVPGIGTRLYKRLLERFGTPRAVFDASDAQLCGVTGISQRLADAIRNQKLSDTIQADMDTCHRQGYRIVTYSDTTYPTLLRHIVDPPPILYVAGTLPTASEFLAIVGTRNPTEDGLSTTRTLSRDITRSGFIVTSGMARGIDTAAHEGALEAGGATVAVLGSGLARIYPSENRPLFDRIRENGAVVTEYPPHAPPDPHHFPMRNRIISGMSRGTLVVEAGKKSGALITAQIALEQNREVFAVPGAIRSFKSYGTNTLIRQGAKLVLHAGDIFEEISPMLPRSLPETKEKKPEPTDLSPAEREILAVLSSEPIHIDDLSRKFEMAIGQLSTLLLRLELKGTVRQLPGHRFVKTT